MCHRRNTAVAFEVFFEKQPFSQSQWHNLHLCLPKELFVNIALYTHCSSYFNLAIFLFKFLIAEHVHMKPYGKGLVIVAFLFLNAVRIFFPWLT